MNQQERALCRRLQPGPGDTEPTIRCDYVTTDTGVTTAPHAEAAFVCTACEWWFIAEFDPTDEEDVAATRSEACRDHSRFGH